MTSANAAIAPAETQDDSRPILPGTPAFDDLLARIGEGAAEREYRRTLPHEQIALLRAARFGALRLPVALGGGGLSMRELFSAVIALAAADANVAHIVRNHFAFVERFAQPLGGEDGGRWTREVAAGKFVGLAGPELTTHPVGRGVPLDTKLVADGDAFVISGTKFYSTGSLFADLILVRAQDAQDRYVSAIIPADRAGVTLDDDWDGIGQRLTGSGTTRLADVRALPEEVVYDEGEGGGRPFLPYSATLGHLYLTAILAGIIRNVVADGRTLLHGRRRNFAHGQAEKPSDDAILQEVLGEIASAAYAAEVVVLAAAEDLGRSADAYVAGAFDQDLAHAAALSASRAKVVVDGLALRAGSRLFDLGGASAAQRENNLDRHWRNARTLASHNPTSYKAQAIGAYVVNGTELPATGFF